MQRIAYLFSLFVMLFLFVGCGDDTQSTPTPILPTTTHTPLPTTNPRPTPTVTRPESADQIKSITIAMDVPDQSGNFANFDEFGNVTGLDPELLAQLCKKADIQCEIIVTPFIGHTDETGILQGVVDGLYDAAMTALVIPDQPEKGIAYTNPYIEIGDVLLVRADNNSIKTAKDISDQTKVAVVKGNNTAEYLGLDEKQLIIFTSISSAVQSVSDNQTDVAIIDNFHANYYAERYSLRLKIPSIQKYLWLKPPTRYGIAIAEENPALLELFNTMIKKQIASEINPIIQSQFVDKAPIEKGDESLIGTPQDRIVIGVVGELGDLYPGSSEFDFINWEVKMNTGSGLVGYDANNQLIPILAKALPTISTDGREYTFELQDNLLFPDGTKLTAKIVVDSFAKAAAEDNRFLNSFLKDDNQDGTADVDSIKAVDENTVKLVLGEPNAYFISLLATPPYFIIHPDCDVANFDPLGDCISIAPYTITANEPQKFLRLEANLNWPLDPPKTNMIEMRFFASSSELASAVFNAQVDIGWHGLETDQLLALTRRSNIRRWEGPTVLKSYLVFEQSRFPWDNPKLRQAVAYAIDRPALSDKVFDGLRKPLFSPIPNSVPGHVSAEPTRSISESVKLLKEEGYNKLKPLTIDLWYTSDDHYTAREKEYAETIAKQLEETEIIRVVLHGAEWNTYRKTMAECGYPTFLLGWPSVNAQRYVEGMSWIGHFIFNAPTVCSNYKSGDMDELLETLRSATDIEERMTVYKKIQELWAVDYPTLDLTQESRDAFSQQKIQSVEIDTLGLMRYGTLSK